jgi:DNA-binding transcriptional LysR family regulator
VGPIPTAILAKHVHLVHADHSNAWRAGKLALLSPRIWRLCDLAAKHHFLRAGVGFGVMPLHMVEADLASGALVEIHVEEDPLEDHAITMSAAYLTNSPPGRAGRWFIDRLKEEAVPRVKAAVAADSISMAGRLPEVVPERLAIRRYAWSALPS